MVPDIDFVQTGACSLEMITFLNNAVKAGCTIALAGYQTEGRIMLMRYLAKSIDKQRCVISIDADGDLNLENLGWNSYFNMLISCAPDSQDKEQSNRWPKNNANLYRHLLDPFDGYPSTMILNDINCMDSEFSAFIADSAYDLQLIFPVDASSTIDAAHYIDRRNTPTGGGSFSKIDIILTMRKLCHASTIDNGGYVIQNISAVDQKRAEAEHQCRLVPLFELETTDDNALEFRATNAEIPDNLRLKIVEALCSGVSLDDIESLI